MKYVIIKFLKVIKHIEKYSYRVCTYLLLNLPFNLCKSVWKLEWRLEPYFLFLIVLRLFLPQILLAPIISFGYELRFCVESIARSAAHSNKLTTTTMQNLGG